MGAFEVLLQPSAWIAVATLTALEIVLGIDNIVFIAIVSERLPEHQQSRARRIGLIVALVMRLALLFALSWIMGLEEVLFTIPYVDVAVTGRSLILLAGGLFLIWKATTEIYHKTEGVDELEAHTHGQTVTFGGVLVQIAIMDMVFSLDSIITAVGMVDEILLMVIAIVVAVIVMIVFADPVSRFVNENPSVKMLALAFLLLIGVLLVAEGTGREIEKGYIYFAMGFSLVVELLNMRYRKNRERRAAERSESGTSAVEEPAGAGE
jgi:predicted tellurium resistance membrane protein TerC